MPRLDALNLPPLTADEVKAEIQAALHSGDSALNSGECAPDGVLPRPRGPSFTVLVLYSAVWRGMAASDVRR